MSLIDKHSFESRSRGGCSNSDYELCRTECCGRFGVEDDELLDFYFDAADLSRTVFLEKGVPCPFCGAADWKREVIEDSTVIPPEWLWAAPSDLRRRMTEADAAPNSRPPSQLPTSPEVQSSDSLRTPSSGGCG